MVGWVQLQGFLTVGRVGEGWEKVTRVDLMIKDSLNKCIGCQ